MKNILDYEDSEYQENYQKYTRTNLLLFTVIAISLGIGSRLIRPFAMFNGIHTELLAAYFIIIFLSILSLPKLKNKVSIENRFIILSNFTIRSSILWFGFTIGWLVEDKGIIGMGLDVIMINSIWYIATTILGICYILLKVRKRDLN